MRAADRDFDMPLALRPDFEQAARSWLADPRAHRPVTPRRSASVLLLRPCATGDLEVFMQHRVAQMAFAPQMLVYPGGGVDPRDGEIEVPPARANPTATPPDIQVAAARELFEECGVLIAGPEGDQVISDLSAPQWGEHRAGLLDRSLSFAEVLRREGLVLRTDVLSPIARWITPECEPRRYDTVFFATTVPSGQEADGHTTEASTAGWVRARAAVEEHTRGPGTMMPPTQVLAEQIAAAGSLSDYFDTPRTLEAVVPSPVEVGGVLSMRAPIDASGRHSSPGD